jgi:hypothetical protein
VPGAWRLVALAILACRAPSDERPPEPGEPGAFAGAAGFDVPASGGPWRPGDRALYAVHLHDDDGSASWQLLFRVSDEEHEIEPTTSMQMTLGELQITETSPLQPVLASVRAEGAVSDNTSTALAPRLFLQRGFIGLCRGLPEWQALEDSGREVTADERAAALREFGRAYGALSSLLRLVESVDCLRDLLWRVMEKPSALSLVRSLGRVELTLQLADGVVEELGPDALPPALRGRPVFRLPLVIELNGKPALECHLTVTTPDPPLELVAGVVRIDAWRPSEPNRRMVLELEGARLAQR